MLAAVIPMLRCPICHGAMTGHSGTGSGVQPSRVGCDSGHMFDVARQGHVSLLAGRRRHQGDDAAMVAHRLSFLSGGHYLPVVAAIRDCLGDVSEQGVLLDVGGGPGWYAAQLLAGWPRWSGVSVDVSVAAARRAAKAHPQLGSVVADVWESLPLIDGAATVATCVFAPRHGAELRRVLAPEGRLVVVTPGPDHLEQLQGPLGLLAVDPDKEARVAEALSGFVRENTVVVRRTMLLDGAAVHDLALMGPSAFHVNREALAEQVASWTSPVVVTCSVAVTCYRADMSPSDHGTSSRL
ncbi:23S rRNA (guanine(748)-N(1))-methyltransferase [Austwickia sp. TVS 96-490-7B]|uniref:putative RNA methyltransferase n=1 Tax=Austwickia sp. TVS 96-490-7B TaxID=2830843 RepID=UPI001C5908A6|nr:methyltransferase domain-containing protein [Austwickia sp. TVS 96-490-7B]MBW3086320.1 23S rRNA (guanine(748)-N(1))-methyltransferase [Austwickia sp. TVS 96-490-7B]